MTTTNDESPFLVDGEAWREDQRLKSIAKRVQDWHHKQQLDILPDFSARLRYWLENVDEWPSERSVDWPAEGDDQPAFTLTVDPKTADDWGQLHRWRLDWFRNSLIQSGEQVVKYNWQGFRNDPDETAFIIKSIDDLVSDFERRLSTTLRKEDLIKHELQETSESIDSTISARSSGLKTDNLYCIDKLRSSLETNKPLELALFGDSRSAGKGLYRLAKFWDIVHYEAYLKDRLVEIGNSTLSSHTQRQGKQNEDPPKYTSFSELFFDPLYEVPCVDVLRNYRPEKRILEGNVWHGGVKHRGLIVAWIERMENMNPPKIRHLSDRKQLVELLNKYFTNLDMGKAVRVWSDPVDGKIKDKFTSLLPE